MTEVSVIIPTWQRADLLRSRSLPSVLAQDADLECIVVADGPDRAAGLAVRAFADSRLRYLVGKRPAYTEDPISRWHAIGAAAINRGLDAARGDWLLIMGDDDELEPGGLTALLAAQAGAAVVYGTSRIRQRDGGWVEGVAGPPAFRGFPTGGAVIRRSALGPTRFDPEAWRRGVPADTDFWRRLHALGCFFRRIPAVVYRYYPSYAGA